MGQKILQISPTDFSLVRFRTRWPTSPSPTGAERQSPWLRRRCLDSCQFSPSSFSSMSSALLHSILIVFVATILSNNMIVSQVHQTEVRTFQAAEGSQDCGMPSHDCSGQHQVLHMIVTAKRYYRCDCSGQYHHYAADHIGQNENNKKFLMITPVTMKTIKRFS